MAGGFERAVQGGEWPRERDAFLFELREILATVRRRRLWLVFAVTACLAFAGLAVAMRKAEFVSTAQVLLDPRGLNVTDNEVVPRPPSADVNDAIIETQIRLLNSDAVIGRAETAIVLDLIRRHLDRPEAKVTALRRSEGSWICGSVNVKNREGIYSGERGFVVDLSVKSFARVPDGPELLNPRVPGFAEMEQARQLYFKLCLD